MTALKTYIGDAVYADISDGMIVLTTEDGVSATNTIFLEEEVWVALQRFVRVAKERINAPELYGGEG